MVPSLTMPSCQSLLPSWIEKLYPRVSVSIYEFDNAVLKVTNAEVDLLSISSWSSADMKIHVHRQSDRDRDFEPDRIVAACGDRQVKVYILPPPPPTIRYILKI